MRQLRVIAREHLAAERHDFRRRSSVSRRLEHRLCDQGDRLGQVERETTCLATARDVSDHIDEQLLLFAGRELHVIEATPGTDPRCGSVLTTAERVSDEEEKSAHTARRHAQHATDCVALCVRTAHTKARPSSWMLGTLGEII